MITIGDVLLQIAPYAVTLLAAFIGIIVFRWSKLRRLFRLLGIDSEARRVVLYMSSLFVPAGSAFDFRGQARSYEGITIPTEEFSTAVALARLLPIDPFENVPPVVRRPLEERFSLFKQVKIDVNASPMREADIDFSTRSIICLGSQGYNDVTDYCLEHNLAQLAITGNGTHISIIRGKHSGEVIRPPSPKHDIAILEKVVDQSRDNTTIVIAAGLGVIGTMGAANYLLANWPKLEKQHGEHEFALVLQFGPAGETPLADLLRGTVVRTLPGK